MNTPPILTPDQVVTASKHNFSPHKYITFESMFFYCKLLGALCLTTVGYVRLLLYIYIIYIYK